MSKRISTIGYDLMLLEKFELDYIIDKWQHFPIFFGNRGFGGHVGHWLHDHCQYSVRESSVQSQYSHIFGDETSDEAMIESRTRVTSCTVCSAEHPGTEAMSSLTRLNQLSGS